MDERETTAVIDRTLAGDPPSTGYPEERALQELTLALSAERAAPEETFVAELDERVRTGFPRERARRPLAGTRERLAATLPAQRPPLALLGGVASLLAVLAVVVSLSGDPDEPADGGSAAVRIGEPAPGSGGGTAEKMPDQLPSGALEHQAPPGVARDSLLAVPRRDLARRAFAPGTRDRRIERSASLTLAAPADELDDVATAVTRVTERHRGFVLRSSLTTGDEGATTGGDFELRIPASRLQPALADLSELGQVRARSQSGDDVTAAFVTAGDQLEAARAERRNLLTRLEEAQTDVEAESLRLQLDANAGEINRLQGRIRVLRIRTDYARVGVVLEARDGESAAPGDGLGGAVDDALDSLGDSLEIAIRAIGVLIPIALLVGAAGLAYRAARRRRRESALT